MELSVEYEFLPKKPSVRASEVMDHFGIGFETGKHVIANGLKLSIQEGDVVCFVGDSGSGKSSLMRAVGEQLKSVVNVDELELGNEILVEGVGLDVSDSLPMFSSCGLGEAQLLLRTPQELSDGQCYRYRLLKGIAEKTAWVLADEFTATLDRSLGKVIAFNVRRIADRNQKGFLLATTHEDVLEDLQPDVLVRCSVGEEPVIEYSQAGRKKKRISFADRLSITKATRADWPYFARWHYRSHKLGFVRFMTLLWNDDEPIGICVFTTPAKSLRQRSKYFGLSGKWSRLQLQALNKQLVTLSRVVMHPTYRGAGLAADFIRKSCELCEWPWVETLAQMGNINPFFERAGFVRVGSVKKKISSREKHSAIYGASNNGSKRNKGRLLSKESHEKSEFAEPVYYVFENKGRRRNAAVRKKEESR